MGVRFDNNWSHIATGGIPFQRLNLCCHPSFLPIIILKYPNADRVKSTISLTEGQVRPFLFCRPEFSLRILGILGSRLVLFSAVDVNHFKLHTELIFHSTKNFLNTSRLKNIRLPRGLISFFT